MKSLKAEHLKDQLFNFKILLWVKYKKKTMLKMKLIIILRLHNWINKCSHSSTNPFD